MATSGAISGSSFSFSYALVKASSPTEFFTGTFTAGDVKVVKRTGTTTAASVNITTLPTHKYEGVFQFDLSASEMTADEVVVVINAASADVVDEAISIVTETSIADVRKVTGSSVSGVADFKATGFSTFDASTDTVTTDAASRTASQADVSSLATASALTVVDTEVGQIKAKTDQLTFTVSNQVDANALTGGSDATAANQSTIINHLTDVKGAGWTSTDNLAEITEDVTGLNGAAMRGTDGAVTTAAPTAADIYSEFTSGSNEDAFKADVSGLATASALSTVDGKIDTLDTVADSILADTGTDGVVLSTATLESIADTILKRDVDNVEATANEHTLATIILCLLESSRSSTTWTIKRSDGVTTHATKTLTLDSTADPVIGVD
tara:strand:+ start:45 stop:1190 length:1146 start_codon:yes stop_codon:yes gene_type:complete